MKIRQIDAEQNFRSLNIKKVANGHKKFVRMDWGEVKKLSEQYDITMKTCFGEDAFHDSISIVAKPLKKDLNFFKRFNRPKGSSVFYIQHGEDPARKGTTILSQTLDAINNIAKTANRESSGTVF